MASSPGNLFATLDDEAGSGPVTDPFDFARWTDWTVAHLSADLTGRYAVHEIFVIERGHVWHLVDGETRELGPGTLALVAAGQYFNCVRTDGLTGWRLRFTDDILPDGWQSTQVFAGPGRSLTLTLGPDDLRTIASIAGLVEVEVARPTDGDGAEARRHLLALLLVHTERHVRSASDTAFVEREDQTVFHAFVTALERDFTAHHDVQHYAETLGLSSVRLSMVVNRVLGVSTKRAIDDRLVLETRRLLRYSTLSVGEIAARLGYADQFHLSRIFKRHTGMSPLVYRRARK